MLTLNTSQPKRLYTNAITLKSIGQYIPASSQTTVTCSWIDLSNKYLYLIESLAAAPWLRMRRFTYDTAWNIGTETEITLSGFGTFSSSPNLYSFQGSASGNFYLSCGGAGWSANFVVNDVCTVSISGTTATKGANLSVPVVGSYTLNRVFAKGAVVYAFYSLTASPYTADTGRKYSWSWSSLAGAALPTSVLSNVRDNGQLAQAANASKLNHIPVWSGADKFYNHFNQAGFFTSLIFNASTDTWSASPYAFTEAYWEMNWQCIIYEWSSPWRGRILNSSGVSIWNLSWALGNLSSVQMIPIDLTNWIWCYSWSTGWIYFHKFYSGAAKRAWKWISAVGGWILSQIDWSGEWSHFFTPNALTTPIDMDYYWETSLTLFLTMWTISATNYLEITD